MSKTIDISSRLTNSRTTLTLAPGVTFEIDDSKNTVVLFQAAVQSGDIQDIAIIDDMIKMFLGEEAVKVIDDMNLSMAAYQSIMIAIMSVIQRVDYEVAEARFRDRFGQ